MLGRGRFTWISQHPMFRRTLRLMLAGAAIASSSGDASAQVVRALTAAATVPDIGVVTSVAPLQWADPPHGEVSGSVTTKHNGPYVLQVRLTSAHADTVLARQVDGTYRALDTSEWVAVAGGAGGANVANAVNYRIKLAVNSGESPAAAPPLSYRVVSP
jgi:hypothetical protein